MRIDTAMQTQDPQAPRHRRLTLDLDIGSDPLTGVLHDGERQTAFTGWLALASALLRAGEESVEDA
jgi:hypothetical protein